MLSYGLFHFEESELHIFYGSGRVKAELSSAGVRVVSKTRVLAMYSWSDFEHVPPLALDIPSASLPIRISEPLLRLITWLMANGYVQMPLVFVEFFVNPKAGDQRVFIPWSEMNQPWDGSRHRLGFPIRTLKKRTRLICEFWISKYHLDSSRICSEEEFTAFESQISKRPKEAELESVFSALAKPNDA